jgi:hypothetical protein
MKKKWGLVFILEIFDHLLDHLLKLNLQLFKISAKIKDLTPILTVKMGRS